MVSGTGKTIVLIACSVLGARAAIGASAYTADDVGRQSLEDAWWTGPIVAASAATLPKGHVLVEPYVYDVITQSRFDQNGHRQEVAETHGFGSQTYLLYGLVDTVSIGLIPRFGFNDVSGGSDSSGVRVGDLSLQAQYRLTQFSEGRPVPTTSLVVQLTFPTGKHDRLGERLSDGMGSGAYSATLAFYSQYYFWMPNGRILRGRFNVSQTFSDTAQVRGASVYGTAEGFSGRASPGDSLSIIASGEYSLTRNWVFALDLVYQRDDSTHVEGIRADGATVREQFPSGHLFGAVPAIEYNFTSRVGMIAGARWFVAGRNAPATVTPVVALNMVF